METVVAPKVFSFIIMIKKCRKNSYLLRFNKVSKNKGTDKTSAPLLLLLNLKSL